MAFPFLQLATLALATALKARGQQQVSRSSARIATYNAGIARFNAAVAVRNAQLIEDAGMLEKTRARKRKESLLAEQRVLFAKAGVRSTGSPFEVAMDTIAESELDLQIDFFNAQVSANRERTQAQVDLARARVSEEQSRIARQASFINPLITLTSGFQSGLTILRNINKPAVTP